MSGSRSLALSLKHQGMHICTVHSTSHSHVSFGVWPPSPITAGFSLHISCGSSHFLFLLLSCGYSAISLSLSLSLSTSTCSSSSFVPISPVFDTPAISRTYVPFHFSASHLHLPCCYGISFFFLLLPPISSLSFFSLYLSSFLFSNIFSVRLYAVLFACQHSQQRKSGHGGNICAYRRERRRAARYRAPAVIALIESKLRNTW